MSSPLIVATGASGQLGQTLKQLWAESPIPNFQFVALDRSELDVASADRAIAVLDELKPAVVINAAAYTQVDKAESDRSGAFAVNDEAAATLATWVAQNSAQLLHISTDFVFDGKGTSPYQPDQTTEPLGVYGASKLAGEQQLIRLAAGRSAIIRTAWLYSQYGNNFVKTMLRLMAERDELSVVDDQVGSPTSTHSLAELIFAMIAKGSYDGIYHWTDGGSISWFDFAVEIQQQAVASGLLAKPIPIHPIGASEYPTPAQRPAYSVLDCSRAVDAFDCPNQDWKAQLSRVLKALTKAS